MMRFHAIVLAGGLEARMVSGLPTALHEVAGKPLIHCVLSAVLALEIIDRTEVLGRDLCKGSQFLRDILPSKVRFMEQSTEEKDLDGICLALQRVTSDGVLVVEGTRPLLTARTIARLIDFHTSSSYKATWLGISDKKTEFDKAAGVYAFETHWLVDRLKLHERASLHGSIRDVCIKAAVEGTGCGIDLADRSEALQVGTRVDLAQVAAIMRDRIGQELMRSGVQLVDPKHTYIDSGSLVGRGTIISPGATVEGKTTIGQGCSLGPNVIIRDSVIEDDCTVEASAVIEGSKVGHDSLIGTQVYLAAGSAIPPYSKIQTQGWFTIENQLTRRK